MALKITPLEDLARASQGTLIELPPFVEGQPFVACLKRPSLLALVRAGKIPNSLIATANELFVKGGLDTDNDKALSNLFEVLDAICEACFVEPTYEQIKAAGITLTDDQLMFVFNYTQQGVTALGNFRSQLPSVGSTSHESTVPKNAKRAAGNKR